MTFQYFFFNTYPGYFLQMVPFALVVGIGCAMWKYRRGVGKGRSICSGLLAAYLAGLVGVTLLLQVIGELWYVLIYHRPGGSHLRFFEWTFDFVPDFWRNIRGETITNAFLFVPFGVLYPLAGEGRTLLRTLAAGAMLVLAIELLQPIFGRAFDVNDVILNLTGIAVSTAVFRMIHK